MTDAQLTIIIAVIPSTLLALGTIITSMRNGAKSDTLIKKADEIHTLTNSANQQLQMALATAVKEIEGLKALVASQADAAKPRDIPGPQGPIGETGPQGEKGATGAKGQSSV